MGLQGVREGAPGGGAADSLRRKIRFSDISQSDIEMGLLVIAKFVGMFCQKRVLTANKA